MYYFFLTSVEAKQIYKIDYIYMNIPFNECLNSFEVRKD